VYNQVDAEITEAIASVRAASAKLYSTLEIAKSRNSFDRTAIGKAYMTMFKAMLSIEKTLEDWV